MCNMYSACAHLNCKYISKICNFVCCPNIFANTIHFELKYWACDVYSSKRRLKSIRICSHRMQTTSLWLHTDITQHIQIFSSKSLIPFLQIVPIFSYSWFPSWGLVHSLNVNCSIATWCSHYRDKQCPWAHSEGAIYERKVKIRPTKRQIHKQNNGSNITRWWYSA